MHLQKLNKWADLLLDTGKRNNLINFKDAKMGSVEILSPHFSTLLSRAEHSATFEVYDPKLEEDEDSPFGNGYLSKQEYLIAYGQKLKKTQILTYNAINKPIAALKAISKRARSAIEETGVNIAYLAFGFIHWTERENSQTFLRAPILLSPITIENESSIEPYYVKVAVDEILVNPTFAFKLQNEYGIKLPDFDEDEGIEAYFSKIEELLSKLKWRISTECKIGIFSFLKINMYKDLKENGEKITKNKNLLALLGERVENFNQPTNEQIPGTGISDLHNVVDADCSQSEAIQTARQGTSFVLQGPPGTGKSQTITNIIAECLVNDKKVLFVSEKLAALNVVYEKLKTADLEEFCLELHSHKASKKQVIDELCHTLKLQKSGVSDQAERELKNKKDAQDKLDGYEKELHKLRPVINKTLYGLYDEAAACRDAPDLHFVVKDVKNKGEAYLDQAESALSAYVGYLPSIGYDYHENVWYGYRQKDSSYAAVLQTKEDLLAFSQLSQALHSLSQTAKDSYGLKIRSLKESHTAAELFNLIKDSGFITPPLFRPATAQKALETVKNLSKTAKTVLDRQTLLNAEFDKDVYNLDGTLLYKKLAKQYVGFFSRLFSREYKTLVRDLKLCSKSDKRISYDAALKTAKRLHDYQENSKQFDRLQKEISGLLGSAYTGLSTDFSRCETELQNLTDLQARGVSFERLASLNKEEFEAQKPVFAQLSQDYERAFSQTQEEERRVISYFDPTECDLTSLPLKALCEKIEGCYENADKIDNWCEFVKILHRLHPLGLRAYVDLAIEYKVPQAKIVTAYKKAFYSQWVDAVLHDSPLLLGLARVPHDEAVRLFKEKDALQFEINKAKIKAKLSTQRPNTEMVAPGSALSILLREGEKKRKQKGIRQLLSEIGDLAQTLKPCFLMSPLSVSTYLSANVQFDVVIFDEASQIFPQDAVGAIYRGKQLIVVGDSKQMPPSNFFTATADGDMDEEIEDVTDFESILDLCSTSFPQRRLRWHYRSRFEPLIAFSNKNFYDGELVTFPSSQTDKAGIGVDYVHVDGIFDRTTKTNRAEAEKIVDMVFQHAEQFPNRSLGVVAFSISQQNLIDRLISKRRQKDPSKEEFFRSDKAEPFFIKNLETVQGDERDVIIFSVAYGKDAYGKLLLNFGPINREGGERRLNVAFTRAKYNVKLVTSMHHTDLDLSGSKSVGARLLKEYLDYAENGANLDTDSVVKNNPFEATRCAFEKEVCEFLQSQGFTVDRKVGRSAFKIDLAVKYPHSADYALAIECDGENYHSTKTTRDRDRLRQEVLERMGWKFYRIWSTDWFRNKRIEKENLLAAVQAAFKNSPEKKKTKISERLSFEKTVETQQFSFPEYEQTDEFSLARLLNHNVLSVVRAMLEKEAPLCEEWLLKRIVFLFDGREKVTGVVRDRFNFLLRNCESFGILRANGFLYLKDKPIPMLRVPKKGAPPREVKYICAEELANGLKEVLKQNVIAEKTGLFRLLAAQLGFARIGDSILVALEGALQLLAKYSVKIEGETISLLK